jgi:3-hydroxymyristoyl/3-hydroxydecanoyl-(acyl carrier protein) dehydratase
MISTLQQTYPFLYVDKVETVETLDQKIVAIVDFSDRSIERFSCGKEVPGYVLLESLAQTSGLLMKRIFTTSRGGLLVGVVNAKFYNDDSELNEVKLHSKLIACHGSTVKFFCEAYSDGCKLVSAEIHIYINDNDNKK